jgi:penicillin-binding protein 1A
VHAEYVAEMARQLIFAQYGNDAYTRGLNVYTTLNAGEQEAAYNALRRASWTTSAARSTAAPRSSSPCPPTPGQEDAIDDALANHPDNGDVLAAVVLEASPARSWPAPDGEKIEITGDGLKPVQSGLSDKAPPNIKIRPGAVIRVVKTPRAWEITQLPESKAPLWPDPQTGAIRALVGGFDFDKNKFNHVTQAWRQPGSSFKPFIYSAALEKGFTPATMINDAPLFFSAAPPVASPGSPRTTTAATTGP